MLHSLQLVLHVTFFVVFSMYTEFTNGFVCYRDRCQAGRQYCVNERERCFHCSDREGECGMTSMPDDCAAYCAEVDLKKRLSDLNGTNENLRTQTLQCSGDLNKTHSEIIQLSAQIKDSQERAVISKNESRKLANEITVLKNEKTSLDDAVSENSERHSEKIKYLQNEMEGWRTACVLGWVLLLLNISWRSRKCLRRFFKRRSNLTDNAKLLGNHEVIVPTKDPEPEVRVDIPMEDIECAPEYEDSGQGSTSTLDSEVHGGKRHSQVTLDRQSNKRTGPTPDERCKCRHSHETGVKPCKCNQPIAPTKGENSERAAMVLNPTSAVTYQFPVH